MFDIADPSFNPHKLSINDKIVLVRQLDGLLVDILAGCKIKHIYLYGCTSLTHLPDGLKVERTINLDDCTSLTNLPDGLKVGGYLSLNGCISLTHLPDNLKVGGDLYLGGCTSLTHLPDGLKVEGDLYLIDCIGLQYYEKNSKAKWRRGVKGDIIW